MRTERWWGAYRKDIKRLVKRSYDLSRLYLIVELLRTESPLPPTARPHKLSGKYEGLWECHIGHDWLLIYSVTEKEVLLARTGTHADLFE